MAGDQQTAAALQELIRAVGQVEGKIESLQTAQASTAAAVRADVGALHAKIETAKSEFSAAVVDLYRNGTAFCPVHKTHEDRLRAVEGWRDNQTGAAASAGGVEGSKRGGIWGALASVAVSVLLLVAERITARLETRAAPNPAGQSYFQHDGTNALAKAQTWGEP